MHTNVQTAALNGAEKAKPMVELAVVGLSIWFLARGVAKAFSKAAPPSGDNFERLYIEQVSETWAERANNAELRAQLEALIASNEELARANQAYSDYMDAQVDIDDEAGWKP